MNDSEIIEKAENAFPSVKKSNADGWLDKFELELVRLARSETPKELFVCAEHPETLTKLDTFLEKARQEEREKYEKEIEKIIEFAGEKFYSKDWVKEELRKLFGEKEGKG